MLEAVNMEVRTGVLEPLSNATLINPSLETQLTFMIEVFQRLGALQNDKTDNLKSQFNSEHMEETYFWFKLILARFNRSFDSVIWTAAGTGLLFPVEASTPCIRDILDILIDLIYDDQNESLSRFSWQMINVSRKVHDMRSLSSDAKKCSRIKTKTRFSRKVGKTTNEYLHFVGEYCIIESWLYSNSSAINELPMDSTSFYGLCFPSTCSLTDKILTVKHFGDLFNVNVREVFCLEQAKNFSNFTVVIISVLLTFPVTMVILATILDYFEARLNLQMRLTYYLKSILQRMTYIFSANASVKSLLVYTDKDISSINGIWSLLTVAVVVSYVFGHYSQRFDESQLSSDIFLKDTLLHTTPIIIAGTPVAANIMFILSGFCLIVSLTKRMNGNRLADTVCIYFHKYIRLTALYSVVILFVAGPYIYINDGIFDRRRQTDCQETWWSLLLYIENIVGNSQNTCIPSGWYMDMNMQLGLAFFPLVFLIVRFNKHPIYFAIAVQTVVTTMTVLHQKIKISNWLNYCGWSMFFISVIVVFLEGQFYSNISWKQTTNFHYIFSNLIWNLSSCWIIIYCISNQQGRLNRLLSCGPFQITGKLSLNVLLMAKTMSEIWFNDATEAVLFTRFQMILHCLSVLAACFIFSIVVYITIESPCSRFLVLVRCNVVRNKLVHALPQSVTGFDKSSFGPLNHFISKDSCLFKHK
ncbi:hypothetical protein CHUAL_003394 [Chamberlinius hualienensis]